MPPTRGELQDRARELRALDRISDALAILALRKIPGAANDLATAEAINKAADRLRGKR